MVGGPRVCFCTVPLHDAKVGRVEMWEWDVKWMMWNHWVASQEVESVVDVQRAWSRLRVI